MRTPVTKIDMVVDFYCFCRLHFKRHIFYAIIAMAFSYSSPAQKMASTVFTAKDGMPSNYVFSTHLDKLGYLWVCTPEGVGRFDGKHFTNYGLQEGLPDLRVLCGFMDRKKRLWVGTIGGIAEFKGSSFISYPLSDSSVISWVYNFIETKEGHLWALTNFGVEPFFDAFIHGHIQYLG